MPTMSPAPRSSQEYHKEVAEMRQRYNYALEEYHRTKNPADRRFMEEWAQVLEEYVRLYQNRFG